MKTLPSDIRIAPSILSADFATLGSQVQTVLDAGARVIHIDVMDGQFVPPITMGPIVVEALASQVKEHGGVLDVHLMIENPDRQIEAFAAAGADTIVVHYEADLHLHRTLGAIREAGVLAGVAICPGTPVEVLAEVGDLLDLALVMSVNPGWGGQKFIEGTVERIARLKDLLGPEIAIEVDGGIDAATAPLVVEAGARLLVAGSAIFSKPDVPAAYSAIAAAAGAS
ncbi:MAG: ribulose-phosphate 3-epimerase [Actinobacteria bacterium]|uniref:ribulose-phosphate 3-epimerase n=1 Tax=freshwater metagenome TaxID=449393 RepID=A0A6J7D3M1_9ZZZZ|nr:ribulose-phosphate 3-epimerase [Actinomycetota bacterium]